MADALSIGHRFEILHIEALSEDDANRIVKKYGGDSVPDWVPSRALLLSYLAAKNFLRDIPSLVSGMKSRGHGWDALLRMICEREANQHPALQGPEVLMFLERLATIARSTSDGLGAFSESDLSAAFESTCGFPPDDSARILISRLPALASIAAETGKRRFIDIDIADAARAGDDFRYFASPYDPSLQTALKEVQVAIGANGLERLSYIAEKDILQAAQIEIAVEGAANSRNSILALDGLQLMMDWGLDFGRPGIDLMDVQIQTMSLDEDIPDLSRVRFIECIIDSLYIGPNAPEARLPRFERCLIGSLDGVATRSDLPKTAFHECDIDEFRNSTARNAMILETDLPMATKVLLTVLNKLFNQAGRGRKENAFHRGLETRARALVPSVLNLVSSLGFATPTRIRQQTIWIPRRDKNRRVFDILNHPNTSGDALLSRVKNL